MVPLSARLNFLQLPPSGVLDHHLSDACFEHTCQHNNNNNNNINYNNE